MHLILKLAEYSLCLNCDDPAGRHLGRSGPTNPPQKEQCRRTVYTVLTHWARGAKTRSPYDQ